MVRYILIHSELADTAVHKFWFFVLLVINLENPADVIICYVGYSYI